MKDRIGCINWVVTGLTIAGAVGVGLLPARRAAGCGGTPPPPFCGKSLVLAKPVPGVIVNNPGFPVTVTLPFLAFLAVTEFPPGSGACPPAPYAISNLTVALTCAPPPGVVAVVPPALLPPLVPGFNVIPVTITIPPGPARICTVVGSLTITCPPSPGLPGGLTLTAVGDTTICIVDPAPNGQPRLDLRHADPDGQIVRVHPGDQAFYHYILTNNDPNETFTGIVTADMRNSSRMPQSNRPSLVYAISDPGDGDDFPIAFCEDLDKTGCVVLPPDPQNSIRPTIRKPITLDPGESTIVSIAARSWPMCANGSCGESTIVLRGGYSDGTEGVACAGAVYASDTSVEPQRCCPDSGQVVQVGPASGDGQICDQPFLSIKGQPTIDSPFDLNIGVAGVQLNRSVRSAPVETFSCAGALDPEYGRIETQVFLPFDENPTAKTDSFFDIIYDVEVRASDDNGRKFARVLSLDPVPGAPAGFEGQAPLGMGVIELRDFASDVTGVDSFFDIFVQLSATAGAFDPDTFEFGEVPIEIVELGLMPTEFGYSVQLVGHAPEAQGRQLEFLAINHDVRGVARPAEPFTGCPVPCVDCPDGSEPKLITIQNGLGAASDEFISPLGETVPFDSFTLTATEPVRLVGSRVRSSGVLAATTGVRLRDDGAGQHTVVLDRPVPPGQWLRVTLDVESVNTGCPATFVMWVAHHPCNIDQNDVANIRDVTAFGNEFRGSRNRPLIDLNGDGSVNTRDATSYGNHWFGRRPATRAWANSVLPPKP